MHMPPMQQAEVMVKMVSESMKAVLKSNKKRTRKKELWESSEAEGTTDDEEEEGGVILSVRKLLSGIRHEATLVEMSRLGVQTPYDLRQTTQTTSTWAERCNTLLTQNDGVRQRLMMSGRGERGADMRLPEGQREVEKRRWMKRTWMNNWEEMETRKKAIHEADTNPEGAARVLKMMKEREAGQHETGSLWDQARKDVITESAKSGMFQCCNCRI